MKTHPTVARIAHRTAIGLGVVLVVAGCGPVNAGDGAEVEYSTWIEDVDGVASLEIGSQNTLPFHAEVHADVVLVEGLSAEEVADTLTELDTFTFEESNASLDVEAVYVIADAEITMTGLSYAEPDVWASVVTDPALRQVATSVTVTAYPDGGTGVEAVTREDPFEAARVLDDVIERHMGVEIAPYRVENQTRTSGLSGHRTGSAREVYEALRAEFPLAGARVREGSVYLTLPDMAPEARALLVSELTGHSTADVLVSVRDAPGT